MGFLAHFLLCKFSLVAKAFLQALHQKCLTFGGMLRFHTNFQNEGGGMKEEEGLEVLLAGPIALAT